MCERDVPFARLLAGEIGDKVSYNGRMIDADDKLRALEALLQDAGRVAVAFSGGVDSTFLLAFAACTPGVQATALTAASSLMPDADLSFAEAFCARRSIPHQVIQVDPLSSEDVRANGPERCYHCKRLIMEALTREARVAAAVLCDGSNADDAQDYRPGARAIQELGVRSPLAEAGLTKQEIRAAARALGLPNADAPASACLASRIPYGTPLTPHDLARVAQASPRCACGPTATWRASKRCRKRRARSQMRPFVPAFHAPCTTRASPTSLLTWTATGWAA